MRLHITAPSLLTPDRIVLLQEASEYAHSMTVIDTRTEDFITDLHRTAGVTILRSSTPERNISRWWNEGLLAAPTDTTHCLVMNDDVRIRQGTLTALMHVFQQRPDLACVFPDQYNELAEGSVDVLDTATAVAATRRMIGYFFILNLSKGLLADESIKWWYGDDDLDWQCRNAGGVARVGCRGVEHLHPNQTTDDSAALTAQTGLDRKTFFAKWGRLPH